MNRNEIRKRNIYLSIILVLIILIDLVLILNADKENYSVVFLDGEEVYSFVVKENEKVKEVENENENFLGWYLDDSLYDFNRAVKSNLVLKAKYENTVMHKVTFDTDGGSEVSAIMVKDSKTLIEVQNPTKENYRFLGWYLEDNLYDFNLPVTTDFVLKAHWEELADDEKTYTITFDTDGGSEISPIKVRANEYPIKPSNPTKLGYDFKEWQLNGKTFYWNFLPTSNITLKAVWTAKKSLKLTFNSSGGSTVADMNVYKGDTANLPEPTKAGYVFAGWYYRNTKYTNTTVINSSVTLTAKWITTDEANAEQAIKSIKSSYEILNGGTKIKVTYAGCVITNTNADLLEEITRGTADQTVTLKFNVECGTIKKTATSKAIIKASTYSYQLDGLTLKIVGTNLDGEIFKMDGTKIAYVLSGTANLEEEITENIIFIKHDDEKTKYVLTRKIIE